MASKLCFGFHAFEPAVQTLKFLLHLPQLGQGTVELRAGVSQSSLVQPPHLLQVLQRTVFNLWHAQWEDHLPGELHDVKESLTLRAVQLQLLSADRQADRQ